jgi:purine-binding chemotaxis protein CheW
MEKPMTPSAQPAAGARLLDEVKADRLNQDVAEAAEDWVKIVLFRAGSGRYAFYGHNIREILSGNEIYWVPGLPAFLPGLINVRGDIESVIDIQCLLGEPRGAGGAPGLIAMAVSRTFRSGIMVDAVEDVVDIPVSSIQPPLITLAAGVRDLVAGQIQLGKSLIPLLDIEKLQGRVTL